MTDIISTGIAIDSTDAVKARQDLDNLAGAGAKVDGALSKIDQASVRTGKTLATLAQNTRKVADTNAQMVAQMQQLNTAQSRQEALLKAIGSSFAGLTSAIKGTTTASKEQTQASKDAAKARQEEAKAAKEAARAAREAQQAAEREAAVKASAAAAAERYIQKLREEVQLHGASRSAIEAHRAAQMGLSAEQRRTAELLGGQIDGLNRTKSGLSGIQQVALGVGTAMAVAFSAKRVVDFADALFQASASAQRIKTTLQFATGDSAKEFAYVSKLAKDLGLQLTSTAQAYASFAAASRGTALEGEGARKVFESISKASAVMGLSSEQASGALQALQQMVSKGTVQAEELRGQLAERLPGAFQIAAKAMGVTTAELGKMLEQGEVIAADFLPKFAEALTASLGDAPEKAARRLDASVNLMGNAWERFKRTVGDSGVSTYVASRYAAVAEGLDGVSESMDQARSSGGGFVSQMTALGVEIAAIVNPFKAFVGETGTASEKLKEAETRMVALQARASQGIDVRVQLDRLQQLIVTLREAKAAADAAGGASVAGGGRGSVNPSTVAQTAARQAAFQGDLGAYLNDNSRQTKAQIRDEEYAKARKRATDLITKAEGDQNSILKIQSALKTEIANIDERYKDKKGASTAGIERQNDKSQLQADLDRIQREQQVTVDSNANAQKLIEAQRAAGLVDERSYYAKRLELLRSDDGAQEAALEAQIARLQKETFAGKTATKDRIDNQNKIDELRAKLTKTREAADTNEAVLSIQAASAINQQAAALVSARQAAQDYFDTTQRGFDRQIEGIGKGAEFRQLAAGISQIEERYEQQRQNIQSQRAQAQAQAGGTLTAQVQKQFDDQLAIINEFQAKSIDSFSGYYAKQKAAQADWLNGASEALQNYIDSASNVSAATEQVFSDGFRGAEDALVDFVTTGKLSFKSLADSVIADLARIAIKQSITGPLAKGLLGALSGLSGGGGFGTGSSFGNQDYGQFFAEGGYTGDGGKYQPAGVVHAGEYVITAESTRRLGLDFLGNLNRRSYADGGFVTGSQSAPASAGATAGKGDTINYNFTVGDVATVSMVREAIKGSERRTQNGYRRSRAYAGEAS